MSETVAIERPAVANIPRTASSELTANSDIKSSAFPGDQATPFTIRQLADEYRIAAHLLFEKRRKRKPLSLAPCRLSAIQGIELYLNAYLLHRGCNAGTLRGLQHNFGARTQMAIAHGLAVKPLTAAHLTSMTSNREYIISRYAPEMTSNQSQINRLMATLEEVGDKVSAAIAI